MRDGLHKDTIELEDKKINLQLKTSKLNNLTLTQKQKEAEIDNIMQEDIKL